MAFFLDLLVLYKVLIELSLQECIVELVLDEMGLYFLVVQALGLVVVLEDEVLLVGKVVLCLYFS